MPFVETKELVRLQKNISSVRNICILAHVDHGKTTLADSLVASNEIISPKMAGKIRYLDNRPDEQERGITMKSSCISLYYRGERNDAEYLINLIDSPGHVDFSSEVSTAVRLCDGAIIVVDVVEGVCPQTRACLQETYMEHLKPVLVLNKIDRLILEKKLDPLGAYLHLTQILEQVNAVMGNIFATDILAKENMSEVENYTSALETSDDSNLYFSPDNGNVVFCSAVDGWAFSVRDFSQMYSEILDINEEILEKALWGDYYYNSKKKCPVSGAQEKAKKPMFVQFVLENIWSLYDIVVIRKDKEKVPVIAEKLNIRLTARDLRITDPKAQMKAIFSQWLPIDRTVLEMVVNIIPQPSNITDERAERLLCPANCDFKSFPQETQALKEDFKKCNPNSENVIVFISKMVSVDKSQLPECKPKRLTMEDIQERRELVRKKHFERAKKESEGVKSNVNEVVSGMENISVCNKVDVDKPTEEEQNEENEQVFIAFARIFSGTLKKGVKLYVLSPKHDPRKKLTASETPHINEVEIGNLYLFMGGELETLDEVPAGNILGIGGLENHVIKTATLSNIIHCPSFSELRLMAMPILKVALETVNPLEMPKLVRGLKLLNQADACVQVSVQETGEHIIATLGEVHLEKCVTDLEEQYVKTKLNVSKPIVSFRETIVPEATVDMVNELITNQDKKLGEKIISVETSNKLGCLKMVALPLPSETTDLLEKYVETLKTLTTASKATKFPEKLLTLLNNLKSSLTQSLKNFDLKGIEIQGNLIDKIWSVGPKNCGCNILLNLTDFAQPNFWDVDQSNENSEINTFDARRDYNTSIVNGFQLATAAGPLCEEPMQGVCFVLLEWKLIPDPDLNSKVFGPFSGQVLSAMKDGCRRAFQKQPQRLVSPMYSCNIVVNAEVLGKMYAVIGRRHGKVLSGDLTEGSGNFSVTAVLPVIESFNFAQEIRKQTSGLAIPQLVFSHWEVIDIDPFWVPSTEEEYMHFGEKADSVNRAKVYMESVRQRKGLLTEKKIVDHAEKQRTLSKNK